MFLFCLFHNAIYFLFVFYCVCFQTIKLLKEILDSATSLLFELICVVHQVRPVLIRTAPGDCVGGGPVTCKCKHDIRDL